MTAPDPLERARAVWPYAVPSAEDVDAGVGRLRRRIRTPRRFPRRLGAILISLGLGTLGGLAWAAVDGWTTPVPAPLNVSAPASRLALQSAARAAQPAVVPPDVESSSPKLESAHTMGPKTSRTPALEPSTPQVQPNAAPNTAAQGATAWRDVSQAMSAGDEQRASSLLEALSKDGDAAARAKAKLGLAQLALSRGDCDAARRFASQVSAEQVSGPLARRAAELARRCAK